MKLLHTADWHVGKAIRGHSRAGEHRAVLAEMAGIAAAERVDLVIVAGDLFDTAAPTAEAEGITYEGLLALAEVAPVVIVAGNHDSPRRLDAVGPLLALGRVTVVTAPRPPDDGGVVTLTTGDGTPVRVACLPFVSQRAIVRADALMDNLAYENAQTYGDRLAQVLKALAAGFDDQAVNVITAHLFVAGGATGGGERPAHLVDEYGVSAVDFPYTANYVALGHLHRAQAVPGPTAIHYPGSPLALDFGETDEPKSVNLVTTEPGLPARVTAVPLSAGRRLRTLKGDLADLMAQADDLDRRGELGHDDHPAAPWLRVIVTEKARVGLADEIRMRLGDGVVEVRVAAPDEARPAAATRRGRTPGELFADYLDERGVDDARLRAGFVALHDELVTPAGTEAGSAGEEPG
ncbi:MAG: exonuclease SbcCD subunit D [Acidimicrobiales bacterium]